MKEQFGLKGWLNVDYFDESGILRHTRYDNLAMNAGKVQLAKLLGGLTSNYVRYVAIGTDSTAAAATQTALVAEVSTGGGSRTTVSASSTTTTVTNDTVVFVSTWTFSSGFTLREAGLFDLSVLGNMFARTVINETVTSGKSLQISWSIQIQ